MNASSFEINANDGKADRMILATRLLNQRIKDIMCARRAAGFADVMPTLPDLEKTHILFVNAHYKPYAALGFEYNKVQTQSGTAAPGGTVQFSIPQYGDFFFDMVVHARFPQLYGGALTTIVSSTFLPADISGADGPPIIPGSYYNLVDAFGNLIQASTTRTSVAYRNLVQYCEYPGNRMFTQTKFEVNGNPIDKYTTWADVMTEKFLVPPWKRWGYNRLLGQQNPLTGYRGLARNPVVDFDYLGTHQNTPLNLPMENGLYTSAALAYGSATVPPTDSILTLNAANDADISYEQVQFMDGPQTPKPIQPTLDVWKPLEFWYCKDPRLAIASVSIPFGQRYISMTIDQLTNLVYESPNCFLESNLFTHAGYDFHYAATTEGAIGAKSHGLFSRTYQPIYQYGGVAAVSGGSNITFDVFEMYVNNIFVNPEIHDIYIHRVGFSLVRIFGEQAQDVSSLDGEVQLTQLKYPVETINLGFSPSFNRLNPSGTPTALGAPLNGNPYVFRDWHRFTRLVVATKNDSATTLIPANTLVNAVTAAADKNVNLTMGKIHNAVYFLPVPAVDSITIVAHVITFYDNFAGLFFNTYVPYHYGGQYVMTPEDSGAFMVSFALFPGSYQPSGHLNLSRARETFIRWHSQYITPTTPCRMVVVARCINFLVVQEGSAFMRYST
jgi:hypothetical protein